MQAEVTTQKGVLSADQLYDDRVSKDGGKKGLLRISAAFLRVLRIPDPNETSLLEPREEPATVYPEREPDDGPLLRAVQLGSPPGMPEYDHLTYRRHGMLLVQGYHRSGKLLAWCHCGEWTLIAPEEIEKNQRDACKDCMEPSPLLASAVKRMERWRKEQGDG